MSNFHHLEQPVAQYTCLTNWIENKEGVRVAHHYCQVQHHFRNEDHVCACGVRLCIGHRSPKFETSNNTKTKPIQAELPLHNFPS